MNEPSLDKRIRRVFDTPAPIELDEVIFREPARHTWTVVVGVLVAAIVAAVVAVAILGRSPQRVSVSTSSGSVALTVSVHLDQTTVVAGSSVNGTVEIDNRTGASVDLHPSPADGCAPLVAGLAQAGPILTFHPRPIAGSSCPPNDDTLGTGVTTYSIVLTTTYCDLADPHDPLCNAPHYPLSSGTYRVVLELPPLPKGSQYPPILTVTVKAKPFTGAPPFDLVAIPPQLGLLEGQIGPGAPGHGVPPLIHLTFSSPGLSSVSAQAIDGIYQVYLPAGTWSVRSPDTGVCANGLSVTARAWQLGDILYPTAGCQTPPTAP